MKIELVNNQELIIKARDAADYEKALKVAEIVCAARGGDIAAVDDIEFYVHACFISMPGQAADLREEYQLAKAAA